ncbi:12711_t:CDS:1, partial [Racocetra persica]
MSSSKEKIPEMVANQSVSNQPKGTSHVTKISETARSQKSDALPPWNQYDKAFIAEECTLEANKIGEKEARALIYDK